MIGIVQRAVHKLLLYNLKKRLKKWGVYIDSHFTVVGV